MSDDKEYYFDKPENVNFVLRIFYAICGLLAAADIFIHRHTIHSWEDIFDFMLSMVLLPVLHWF